jgi:3-hydroxyisobutyrate dehydrogenase
MTATRTSIGFVGLGNIGGNMAARFLAAGYRSVASSEAATASQHLIEQGLQWCDTPREVAATSEVVNAAAPP